MSVNDSATMSDDTYPYPPNATDATPALQQVIRDEISQQGSIRFSRFMQLALYHPELGYYTRGTQQVSRTGDFYTSVSVGKCFGTILAHRLHSYWIQLGSPTSFHLIKLGANTGQLACDILDCLKLSFPAFYQATTYHICEHLPSMQAVQRETLTQHQEKLTQHDGLNDLIGSAATGVILSNELIDAFPVDLLTLSHGKWQQRMVTLEDAENFCWETQEIIDEAHESFCATLPNNLPDGYTTEYRPGLEQFAELASSVLQKGMVLTIDYGHTHSSFYQASRHTGTLRTYHQHQAGEDPFVFIGDQDITAHVDFTQLGKAFRDAGFALTEFCAQDTYLTRHGQNWLISLEENMSADTMQLIRQFQTLTHPAIMGKKFSVLEAEIHTNKPDEVPVLRSLELPPSNS